MKSFILVCLVLCIGMSCAKPHTIEDSFDLYASLRLDEKCIRRVRPDFYKRQEVYELWIGGKRLAFEKKSGSYKVIHERDLSIPDIENIADEFNDNIHKMRLLSLLDICPTYTGILVFEADSKIIPNEIKQAFNGNQEEVIFMEAKRNHADSTFMLWNDLWVYKILYKRN